MRRVSFLIGEIEKSRYAFPIFAYEKLFFMYEIYVFMYENQNFVHEKDNFTLTKFNFAHAKPNCMYENLFFVAAIGICIRTFHPRIGATINLPLVKETCTNAA
jgi:hypothetical protein